MKSVHRDASPPHPASAKLALLAKPPQPSPARGEGPVFTFNARCVVSYIPRYASIESSIAVSHGVWWTGDILPVMIER